MVKIFFLLLFLFSLFSQKKVPDDDVGKNLVFESEILKQKRIVQVYLPQDYEKSAERKYPVLYILDGQEYFLYPIAYQKMLKFRDKSPDFIVVGIKTNRRKRRILLYEEGKKFTDFLKKELIPFIDSNYRTTRNDDRMYFGWEMAGGFGVDLLGREPSLFSAFILASATHVTRKRIEQLESTLKKGLLGNKYIYFTIAPEENYIKKSLGELSKIFKEEHSENLTWRYDLLKMEDHYTTPSKTLHNAISEYFSDYKPIRFYSLKEFDDYGNLDFIKEYYRKRGERYYISKDIHRETKHFLLLHSMNDDNVDRFEYYNKEFGDYTKTQIQRALWVNKYAEFYARNNYIEKAVELYQEGLKKYPDSALLYNGFGKIYHKQNKFIKAKKMLEKAIELAKENEVHKLAAYQADLTKLTGKN